MKPPCVYAATYFAANVLTVFAVVAFAYSVAMLVRGGDASWWMLVSVWFEIAGWRVGSLEFDHSCDECEDGEA